MDFIPAKMALDATATTVGPLKYFIIFGSQE